MPRITYVDGPTCEVEAGSTVLAASIANHVDHRHACGGRARCSTCRVEVVAGLEHCPEPLPSEVNVLRLNGLETPVRLACQLRPTNDVSVRVIFRECDRAKTRWLQDEAAHEQEIAVLFADLRGFTAFAERQLPFDVLHVLNQYFEQTGRAVEAADGEILSFLGDGFLAIFRQDPADLADIAVSCALAMLEGSQTIVRDARDHYGYELRMGIGIEIGNAVLGAVGYGRNRRFNVIGDCVNTAARVQDMTKETGTEILVTDNVRARLRGAYGAGREFGVSIRGKTGAHRVHEIVAA